jgi:hypothetical protein
MREDRDIATLWDRDENWVGLSRREIISLKRATKMAGFYADDRIRLRVERCIATEHFECDRIGLDPAAAPGQRFFDHMAEEPVFARCRLKICAAQNPVKLGTTVIRREGSLPFRRFFLLDHSPSLVQSKRPSVGFFLVNYMAAHVIYMRLLALSMV